MFKMKEAAQDRASNLKRKDRAQGNENVMSTHLQTELTQED